MLNEVGHSGFQINVERLRNRPALLPLSQVEIFDGGHLNLIVPSMTRGGAERCVLDVASALNGRIRSGKLIVTGNVRNGYSLNGLESFRIVKPWAKERRARFRQVGLEVLSSPNPLAVTHMIRATDLRELWGMGVKTIPVIHNSEPGWHDPPTVYHHHAVPEVVAVCESVANQLRKAGLKKPITVLRHEVDRMDLKFDPVARNRIRAKYGISSDIFLVGMVGQFKAHKCYVRAVRVLKELIRQTKARLLIVGGWDHDFGAGRIAYAATMELARALEVESLMICAGSVEDVEYYYSAFDVFLNTSTYEGMSIATLEAVSTGCPVVTAAVGGQREAITPFDRVIDDPSDISAYVEAILDLRQRPRTLPAPVRQPDLIPRLWSWKAEFGNLSPLAVANADTLIVTSNLNPGGAQRSLVNLLSVARWSKPPWLCILDHVLEDGFLSHLDMANFHSVISFANAPNLIERVASFLSLTRRVGARTICFWNTDPIFKILIAKVLEHTRIRLIDVSPGPMLLEELTATGEIQRRIAFSAADYIRRLDLFIAKYAEGLPPDLQPEKGRIIPNGVPRRKDSLSVDTSLLPQGCSVDYALITCCRLAPNKRLEWLVDLMTCLSQRSPQATLTVVGGVDQRHVPYFHSICNLIATRNLSNIHFVGPRSNMFTFLPAFTQFLMVSRAQGCPNASLEAMACGLPILANSDGGTNEQVLDGITGFNIKSDNPDDLADHIVRLFSDKDLRIKMGKNAREHSIAHFSMEAMVKSYLQIFEMEQ